MSDLDDLINAHAVGELESGNVARLGECVGESHRAFVIVLVVVRCIAAEADPAIDDDVCRLGACLDSCCVNVGLESGADLALGLGGAVELRERIISPTDHGEHVAGGVVDGQQRGLDAGVLL